MKVHFYATLRRIAGGKTVELPPEPGATAREMIAAVIETYPEMESELFDEDGNLYPNVHFFINGRNAVHLDDGLETVIRAEDKIDIFPAVGGG